MNAAVAWFSLQDIELCASEVTLVDGVYSCTLDPKSKYYDFFSRSKNCEAYPHCVCDRQCGPFVDNRCVRDLLGVSPIADAIGGG